MRSIFFGLAALVVLGLSPPASADLLINGSFETGNFTGWTVNANFTEVVPSGFDGYSAENGNHFAALGNIGLPLGTISQSFATTPGATYTLSYYLASNGTTPNEFQTIINGTTVFDQVNIPTQPYTLYTFNFTAPGLTNFTGSTSTLTFGERDDGDFLALDNVSVSPAATAVPEPSTVLVVGTALVGACAYECRRRGADRRRRGG